MNENYYHSYLRRVGIESIYKSTSVNTFIYALASIHVLYVTSPPADYYYEPFHCDASQRYNHLSYGLIKMPIAIFNKPISKINSSFIRPVCV